MLLIDKKPAQDFILCLSSVMIRRSAGTFLKGIKRNRQGQCIICCFAEKPGSKL